MAKKSLTDKELDAIVTDIARTYHGDMGINFIDVSNLPVRDKII